jgi:C4-type Zn-finger protein
MKTPIRACPKCGSTDIQMGGIREGVLYGLTSWTLVCKRCGYKGMPILFDSEEEYKKFLDEIKSTK